VRERLGVSERRACRVLGQARSTQRHKPRVREDELRPVARVVELAREFGRYGYRRMTALLRREGWRVNAKRVERDLEAGGAQSAQEAAETRTALVRRWLVHSSTS